MALPLDAPPARFGLGDPGGSFGSGRNRSTGNSLSIAMKNLSPGLKEAATIPSCGFECEGYLFQRSEDLVDFSRVVSTRVRLRASRVVR